MNYKRFTKDIFRKDLIKSTDELNREMLQLNTFSKKDLERKKYKYMYSSEYYKSKGKQYNNFGIIITILLSFITIIVPFMVQIYTSSVNMTDNALKYKLEIIAQEDISPEEKIKEMNENVRILYSEDKSIIDLTGEVFIGIINYIALMLFICLAFAMTFSYLSGKNYDKSTYYNILVVFIDNEISGMKEKC